MLAYEDALPCEVLRPVAPDRNPATAVFLWGRFGLRGIETLIAGSESGDRVFYGRATDSPRSHRPIRRPRLQAQRGACTSSGGFFYAPCRFSLPHFPGSFSGFRHS